MKPKVYLELSTLQSFVATLLSSPHQFQWSLQGLGMLRLYLKGIGRLHIWDSQFEFPHVSKQHTHSWDFHSVVVAGQITNTRYVEVPLERRLYGARYWKQHLVCGYDAQRVGAPVQTWLRDQPPEIYHAGWAYSQRANEIHLTDATRGTITIMERTYDGPAGEADVYWPYDQTWGDATPRPATPAEVEAITSYALAELTKEMSQ